MKTNFKRLFALLLTLCMLASLMVPVAFAEDPTTEVTPAANEAETYPIRLKDLNHTDPLTATGNDLLMVKTDAYYNYALDPNHSDQNSIVSKLTSAYKDGTLNWMPLAASGEFVYRKDAMYQARLATGKWAAIQIRVSDPGLYALNLTTDRTVDVETTETPWTSSAFKDGVATTDNSVWSGNVNAYIIPVAVYNEAVENKTVTTEATDGTVETVVPTAEEIIPDLMTDKYLVGSISVAADQSDITFDKVRMDYDEYVVVYQASNPSKKSFFLSEMSLLGEAYAKENVDSYALRPFDLTNTDPATYAGTVNESLVTPTVDETTGETTYTYAEYITFSKLSVKSPNWKFKAVSDTANTRMRDSYAYQPVAKTPGAYIAVTIDVPESGEMYLSLVTDKTAYTGLPWGKSASTWTGDVTAYLLPAADYVNLDTSAVADNCIGTKHLRDGETTVTFDKTYLEAGQYVLIYSGSKGYYPVCEAKLDRLSVDKAPEKADIQISETYNLALYNEADPVYSKASNFASNVTLADGSTTTLRNYAADAYEAGNLNWKLENYADAYTDDVFILRKNTDQGLRINNPAKTSTGDWFAIRMRVPQGGYYSIAFTATGSAAGSTRLYMFPAEAAEMTAEQIAAQITPENAIHRSVDGEKINTDKISLGYLDGEYIIVSKTPDSSKDRQIHLSAITLESEAPLSAEDVQFYNFNFFDETNPYYSLINDRYEAVVDADTGVKTYQSIDGLAATEGSNFQSYKGAVISRDAEGNVTAVSGDQYVASNGNTKTYYLDDAIYKSDASGYPNTYNWRPDYTNGNGMESHEFCNLKTVYTSSGKVNGTYNYRLNAPADSGVIASFMLHVNKAGTYDLGILTNYDLNYEYDIYFVDTVASYTATTSLDDVNEYIADNTWLIGEGATKFTEGSLKTVGRVTVDAAGDFLVIFKNDATNKDFYLENITLTPVVEEAAAGVAGKTCATLDAALEAAEPGDTIHLLDAVDAQEILVPAGVTLNLNGQTVYADAFNVEPTGAVVDTTDGQAAIYADEVDFYEKNPQLPLLDKTTGAYHLYNVEVKSVTITGKNSASPKFWFQIDFSNKDALDLIGSSTEMRIQAGLSGDGLEDVPPATADAAFTNQWADKYAANDSIYITVSVVNADVANFALAPQVAANSVTIAGSAMELPVAEEPAPEETPAEPEVVA